MDNWKTEIARRFLSYENVWFPGDTKIVVQAGEVAGFS